MGEQHTQKEEDDAKKECQSFESALRTDVHLPQHLDRLASIIKSIPDTYLGSQYRRNFFIKQTLPRAVQTLLKRGDLDDEDAVQVNNFFQVVLGFIVRLIPHDFVEIVETLGRLFTNTRCTFYLKYGKDDPPEDFPMYTDDKTQEFTSSQAWETSFFLLSNINYFGRIGGFECILDRLRSDTPTKPNLTIVKHLIKPTFKIREILDTNFLKGFVESLLDIVPERVLSLNDEELKNEDKKTITDITRALEGLSRAAFPTRPTDTIDRFTLDVALKCFRSPYLEKRLAGLNDIKEFIALSRKDEYPSKMRPGGGFVPSSNMHGKVDIPCLDSGALAQWLRANNILEQLYGQNMHPELVRRCVEIPKFLATEGLLEDKHLDIIWEASEGKHESICHLIYASIGELSSNLPVTQLDYLYKKISNLPFSNYSIQTVGLIRNFSVNAIHNMGGNQSPHEQPYGLPILWELIQESAPVSYDVATNSLSSLCEMLGWLPLAPLRPTYVLLCLNNLKLHNSVVFSLRLLRHLMDLQPPKRKKVVGGGPSEQSTLDLLESHDLLQLLFDDLDHFKTTVRAALAQQGNGAAQIDIKNAVLVGKFPYIMQTKERLLFLEHVLQTTPFVLSVPQLTSFWNNSVLGALVNEERDDAFTWLEHTRVGLLQKASPPASDECIYHLFMELVPTMRVDQLSKEGFSFFDLFYRYVNFKLHKLTQMENKPFVVQAWDLAGMPTLWRIALEAKDWQVARMAISLLNRSHKNVAPSLQPTAGVHLANYIAQCMAHLASATREHKELQLQRCLVLLLTVLEEFETKRVGGGGSGSVARKRHGVCTQGGVLNLNFQVYNPPNAPKITVVTHSNETIGAIRTKVAQLFDIPYELIRLIGQGKEFRFDSETLGECKVMDGHTIHVTRRATKSETEVEPSQDASVLPSTILSQQQYFHQLFDLLTFNEAIGKRVWELLMLLPTNRHMLDELSNLSTHAPSQIPNGAQNGSAEGVHWDELLDSSSTFKLLYSLQIVESLLLPNMTYSQGESLAEKTEWRERFISLGGVKHLINILMNTDFYDSARGSKRKTCLALLLKLVKYFVSEGDHLRFGVLGDVEPRVFVARLMEIVWGSTGEGHPSTPSSLAPPSLEEDVVKADPPPASAPPPPPPPPAPETNGKANPIIGPMPAPSSDVTTMNFDTINLIPTVLSVEGELVRYAMALICASVLTQRDLLTSFLSYPTISQWLHTLALKSSDESIRIEFTKGLYDLCSAMRSDAQQPAPHTVFLKNFLSFLPSLEPSISSCEQYFTLLNKLVSDSCDGVAGGKTSDFSHLLHQLISMISAHPTIETRRGYEEDKVLVGLLTLTCTLVSKDASFKRAAGEKGIIQEVFDRVLFDIPTADNHGPLCPPRFKRRTSRLVAFELLTELATHNINNFYELTQKLMVHHKPEERRAQWLYLPSGHEKAPCGYVGLRNLGATCYMNSLMQQLFMLPGLRYRMFQAEDASEDKLESLVYQLQVIFGHLQESEKKYYDMQDFCNAYKCDGQPTNTSIQMDVDEFLTMLFDKLETALGKKNNILKDFFGGTIINQIISKGCAHVSEREEDFFTLSLEVKDKKNILESLDLYVEGDMLEGDNRYFCSTCSAKVDALRRCCIKTLPDTLIVHQKRFEFDVELMKRTKLNDCLEFPMRLNMEPYTKEGLARIEAAKQDELSGTPRDPSPALHPPEYYEYELAGILVHAGTADSGHYYSFVKERDPLNGNIIPQWVHFNDTLVEPFSTEDIPKAAFGGYDPMQQWDAVQQKHVTRMHLRVNNAYMLFYDRVKKTDPIPTGEDSAVPNNVPHPTPSELVPRPIFNHVWEENMKFLRDKDIFDVDYFSFLWPLVMLKFPPSASLTLPPSATLTLPSSSPHEADPAAFDYELQCIQLGTRFIVETLAHAKEKASLPELVQSLRGLYQNHFTGCRWFLETMVHDMDWPRQLLFYCTTQETREVFAGLIVSVISFLIQSGERSLYGELEQEEMETDDLDDELDDDGEVVVHDEKKRRDNDRFYTYRKPVSLVIQFMEAYINMLSVAHHHWRYFGQYFLVLRDFASLGGQELRILLERHLVYQLVEFYLGEDSPHARHGSQTRKKMGDKFSSPMLVYMADTLSILVRGCYTRIPQTRLLGELQAMPSEDLMALYQPALYAKALKEGINPKATADIILHLCWEDEEFSRKIIDIIRTAINEVDHDGFKPYFDVFTPLLGLADSRQGARIDYALSAYFRVIELNLKYKSATMHSIRFLAETVLENQAVRHWMADHLDEWVENWLLANPHDVVREQAYNLFGGLVQDPRTQRVDDNLFHRLYTYLLTLLPSAKNYTREERLSNDEIMSGKPHSAWHLVYYCRLLRFFVRGPQEKLMFHQYHQDMANLLVACDQNHCECDENKHELCILWAEMLKGMPELVTWLVRNDRMTNHMLDYYISIRPGEKFRSYNNTSLPPFYQILCMCCDHESFLERVATHRNFDWAVRFLLLETADYPNVANVLYDIAKKVAQHAKFRQRRIQIFLDDKMSNICLEHVAKFLDLMVSSQQDHLFFCEKRGLDFLTRLFEREINTAQDTQNEYPPVLHTLDMLAHEADWMLETPADPAGASQHPLLCAEIVRQWGGRSVFLEAAVGLCNLPPYSFYDQLVLRTWKVLEALCTHDPQSLEQLLAGLHDHLARGDDDSMPAALLGSGGEGQHRRNRMTGRGYEGDEEGGTGGGGGAKNAFNASASYNTFLLSVVGFVLHSSNLSPPPPPHAPSLVPPASPSSSPTITPALPPTPPSLPPNTPALHPLANTAIDLAVLTAKNAYVQQRLPYAIKQHMNYQMAFLQHLAHQKQTPTPPPTPPPSSLAQVLNLLRTMWDHPQHGLLLRENRTLDTILAILLAEGYFMLDAYPSAWETVTLLYSHNARRTEKTLKDNLLRSLGDRMSHFCNMIWRDKQASGMWTFENLCSLIQVLKSLQLIFATEPELKAQFLQDQARALAVLELVNAINTENESPPDTPFPRLHELTQLTTSTLQP